MWPTGAGALSLRCKLQGMYPSGKRWILAQYQTWLLCQVCRLSSYAWIEPAAGKHKQKGTLWQSAKLIPGEIDPLLSNESGRKDAFEPIAAQDLVFSETL